MDFRNAKQQMERIEDVYSRSEQTRIQSLLGSGREETQRIWGRR